jgi:hypothetical protein
MSSKVLGITPGKPGYEQIRFIPYVSDRLVWAKGTVPLCDGSFVSVYWERSGKSRYTYHIGIPKHRKAILYSPGELYQYHLTVNKKPYGSAGKSPIELAAGEYVIEYRTNGD